MNAIRSLVQLRPSNLIILFALPFIVLLFLTSTDYSRSLAAIVGVEPGSALLLPGFLLCAAFFTCGVVATVAFGRRPYALPVAAIAVLAGLALAFSPLALPFFESVVANAVDPFTSPLVVQGETPRRLTEAAAATVHRSAFGLALAITVATIAGTGLLWRASPDGHAFRAARIVLLALHGLGLAWLLLVAHLGFAVGLAVSIRAAVIAYGLAVVLGLIWIGLLHLQPGRWTLWIFSLLVLICLAVAGWQATRQKVAYDLLGSADGTVGIVAGAPRNLVDTVRFGAFPGAPAGEVKLRTLATPQDAVTALAAGDLSGALVPAGAAPDAKVLWRTELLPEANAGVALAALVLAIGLGLITGCGLLHRRHPFSILAEFVIDTLRGIPMLVIILYIGLPLAGLMKSASGGFLDPPNLLRGIVAMAIAYSAYLAEIFRAGINAVPKGQTEAARSMGLSRWSTARLVILPQAFRIVIPPMGNEFIAILKDTSLLSILSIRDITQRMREFQSATFLPFAPYNTAAIVYVLLTLVAASLIARVEHRFRAQRH